MSGIDAYTKLMLHMDGVVDSDDFVDSSLTPKSITVIGQALIREESGYSEYRPGYSGFEQVGEFLKYPDEGYLLVEASEDWKLFNSSERSDTIDFFFKVTSDIPYWIGICDCENFFIECLYTEGITPGLGDIRFQLTSYDSDGSSIFTIQATRYADFALNEWYHVQIVRSGDAGYIFLNGRRVSIGYSYVVTGTHEQLLDSLYVGGIYQWSETVCGRLDEFRISKGVARNVTDFTPPLKPYDTLNDYDLVGILQLNPSMLMNVSLPELLGSVQVNGEFTGEFSFSVIKKQSLILSDELILKGFLRDQSIFNDVSLDSLIDTKGLDYYKQGEVFTIVNKNFVELSFEITNSLNVLDILSLQFTNSLTLLFMTEFDCKNSLLSYNEVEKDIIICNRLSLSSSEQYNGFYFLKIHGV